METDSNVYVRGIWVDNAISLETIENSSQSDDEPQKEWIELKTVWNRRAILTRQLQVW